VTAFGIMGTKMAACCLGAVLLLGAPSAWAQRYYVHTYTVTDGLPNPSVFDIKQDSTGTMWFGTRGGLTSYDGSRWTNHKVNGISIDVAHIAQDSRGSLWIARTWTPVRVFHAEDGAWLPLPERLTSATDRVTRLAVLTHRATAYVLVSTDGGDLLLWDGSTWRSLQDGHTVQVRALKVVGAGFFVGTDSGLSFLSVDGPKPELEAVSSVPAEPILGIEIDRADAQLWLIGRDWIGRLADDHFTRIADSLDLHLEPTNLGQCSESDGIGGLYFGSWTQLFYFHPRWGLETLDRRSGLVTGGATALHLDREGNLWVGSLRGVTKIVSRRFESYDHAHGLLTDEVSATLERRSGEMVLGHPGGITFLGERPRTLVLGDETRARILGFAEDAQNTLWVAASFRGLAAIGADREVRWFEVPGGFYQVVSVFVDSRQILWVGAFQGIFRRKGGSFARVVLMHEHERMTPYVRRIQESPNGGLDFSTASGLLRIPAAAVGDTVPIALATAKLPGHGELWVRPNDTDASDVFAAFESADGGDVWVGTRRGLYRLGDGVLEKVVAPGPEIDRPVFTIFEDTEGLIWFGTDNGVMRWDGREFRHFTVRDGLIGPEVNRAACLVDSRQHVWIGTDQGISVYRQEFDKPRPNPPRVEVVQLESDGEIFSLAAPLSLEHDRNWLVFRFRALGLVNEKELRIRYRLEGLDADWLGPHPLHGGEIRYGHLGSGHYRLHLQAVDAEGGHSDEVISASIEIRAPYWSQLWFQLLAAAGVIGIILAGVIYVSRLRYARRLEESRKRLQALFQNSLDAIALVDDARVIVDANPALCELLGYSRAELVHATAETVVPLHQREPLRTLWPEFLAAGRQSGEVALVRKDGGAREVECRAVARIVPGLHLVTMHDVTERKRTETALRRNERLAAVGTLAAGIAHEINNPVGGILMAAQYAMAALERPGAATIVETALRDIQTDSKRCGAIVGSILRLARHDSSAREPCNLNEVMGDAITQTRDYAVAHGVHVEFQAAPTDPLVHGSRTELAHTFINLIRNAVESDTTEVQVGIAVPQGTEDVCVSIRDSGHGFTGEERERLFDPFYTTRREQGGTGLGLSLAHVIVSDHGGSFEVSGAPGEGATFTIKLPLSQHNQKDPG